MKPTHVHNCTCGINGQLPTELTLIDLVELKECVEKEFKLQIDNATKSNQMPVFHYAIIPIDFRDQVEKIPGFKRLKGEYDIDWAGEVGGIVFKDTFIDNHQTDLIRKFQYYSIDLYSTTNPDNINKHPNAWIPDNSLLTTIFASKYYGSFNLKSHTFESKHEAWAPDIRSYSWTRVMLLLSIGFISFRIIEKLIILFLL